MRYHDQNVYVDTNHLDIPTIDSVSCTATHAGANAIPILSFTWFITPSIFILFETSPNPTSHPLRLSEYSAVHNSERKHSWQLSSAPLLNYPRPCFDFRVSSTVDRGR